MKQITRLKQVSENVMSHEPDGLNVVATLQEQWEITFAFLVSLVSGKPVAYLHLT